MAERDRMCDVINRRKCYILLCFELFATYWHTQSCSSDFRKGDTRTTDAPAEIFVVVSSFIPIMLMYSLCLLSIIKGASFVASFLCFHLHCVQVCTVGASYRGCLWRYEPRAASFDSTSNYRQCQRLFLRIIFGMALRYPIPPCNIPLGGSTI